jgi:hypothetical protein
MSDHQILGGWDVDEGDASIYAMNEEGDVTPLLQIHEEMDDRILPWSEVMACSRLAASAPALLEALQEAATVMKLAYEEIRTSAPYAGERILLGRYEKASAVISKALGK